MAILLSMFAAQVQNIAPGITTELTINVLYKYVKEALLAYGRDKPDLVADDVTGDGGKYYDLTSGGAVVSAWDEDFSVIKSIQYPAQPVSSDETPIYLDNEDWDQFYRSGGIQYLFFPHHAPSSTETVRIVYTSFYRWSASSTTTAIVSQAHGLSLNDYVYQSDDPGNKWIATGDVQLLATHQVTAVADADNFTVAELQISPPPSDFFFIAYKIACIACQAIAEKYSRTSDSLIGADSVNHNSKATEFRSRAEEYCKMYSDHIEATGGDSIDDDNGEKHPMAAFVDIDSRPRFPAGRDYLHRRQGSR